MNEENYLTEFEGLDDKYPFTTLWEKLYFAILAASMLTFVANFFNIDLFDLKFKK